MKIEIDVPDTLMKEIDRIVKGFYHSREEYILEKIRAGVLVDEKRKYVKGYENEVEYGEEP